MAIQEVVLRPGDSISLRLEVPGQPLRLDLSLTPDGVGVSAPEEVPMGAPTIYGGVPVPEVDAGPADAQPVDLTAEFAADDAGAVETPPSIQDQPKVESLAAVEPFSDMPEAVDIPFEEINDGPSDVGPTVTEDSSDAEGLDLDLGDLDDDELSMDIDIPDDDPADAAPAVDIPLDDDLGGDDGGLSVDIPADDDASFQADAMTMVPPTSGSGADDLSLDDPLAEEPSLEPTGDVELDEDGNPKKKFKPNEDDTLPVWTGKARTYKDPEHEVKKQTGSLPTKGGKKPTGAVAPAAKSLPGKAKLPAGAKKPITKTLKKPVTGGVGPAKGPAPGGTGNFTVFLSPPKGAEKKQAAAEIIAEIQSIDINSATTLAGKMIVPVVKGVSEDEAQSVRDRFKDAGLSCRITQKR